MLDSIRAEDVIIRPSGLVVVERRPVQLVLPLVGGPSPHRPDPEKQLAGVDPQWRHHGELIIARLAMTGIPFSADDVRAEGLGEPRHPNHWGALFGAMGRAGVTRPVGVGRSTRRSRAGGTRMLWVGTEPVRGGAA